MAYLSPPRRSYQVCQAVINPAESAHTWIVAGEFPSLADARVEMRRLEKLGPAAILQVDTRIVEKSGLVMDPEQSA